MNNFRTEIKLKKEQNKINYNSKLLLIGSCFTQNIGDKLSYFKFDNVVNPFGILFHIKAIEKLISTSLSNKIYSKNDLFFHNDRWHCFDVHSNLSSANDNVMLTEINSAVKRTKKQIEEASHIIITLGTSWVYRFIETNKLVANCHKIPQKKFLKEILSAAQIVESLENMIRLIKTDNKKATIIFTVSPVRHLKDGFIENQQSKSHLIAAIHQVINEQKELYYFPAYEIMMDDLRDYRFYKSDMIHPNETAINYIWEKFIAAWVDNSSTEIMKDVDSVQKGLLHKPFYENSKKHQEFLEKLNQKIQKLKKEKNINF